MGAEGAAGIEGPGRDFKENRPGGCGGAPWHSGGSFMSSSQLELASETLSSKEEMAVAGV